MPSACSASRSAGGCLTKKPPLEPTGTITVFFTICALTRPSTSVRKYSRRFDQRRTPRATGPKRRWGHYPRRAWTKTSRYGRGLGRFGPRAERHLNPRYVLRTDERRVGEKRAWMGRI